MYCLVKLFKNFMELMFLPQEQWSIVYFCLSLSEKCITCGCHPVEKFVFFLT